MQLVPNMVVWGIAQIITESALGTLAGCSPGLITAEAVKQSYMIQEDSYSIATAQLWNGLP